MNITVVASRDVFEQALAAARTPEVIESDRSLATVLDGAFRARIDAAWEVIDRALRDAFQYGRQRGKAAMDAAVEHVEKLLAEAGARAREFQEALLLRMHEYTWRYIKGAIERVPRTLTVGGGSFTLSTVRCTQKIALGGSLKTNLDGLLELTAEGELEVGADYTIQGA
jgi:hypothetical protein